MNEADEIEAFREAGASSDRVFWLDGGGARPWSGSRSVLGALADDDVSLTFDATSRTVLRHASGESEQVGDDIFTVLEEQVAADGGDPSVSWVGYLGYGCRTDLPGRPADPASGVPDAVWMRLRNPRTLTSRRRSRKVETALAPTGTSASAVSGSHERPLDEYAAAFEEVQRQLRLGNSYEVNLTYRERVESELDPVSAYLRLRTVNPAPYSGYLQHHGVHLLSSSPERFATVDRHRTIEAKPIKGTTPRGATVEEDEEHRRRLATDPKYRAENLMIVDLMRNDLSMVCDPGTVSVPTLMEVESYESVHQLVSTVRGRLRGDVTTIGALRSLFPAGSMTGAPKRRTMEIIDAVESSPRGAYAGAFGWISGDGRADLSVVIRTLVAIRASAASTPHERPLDLARAPSRRGWGYELGTGGGVTVRSTVEDEYAETRWKAARLRTALQSPQPEG
ncbi:MAG: Para-aminobenzoate synthase, aminase component [uncultured Nocardioidaceae bacterium]|uniref:Para-aminobenzoate synthase, aminase component n=1 Tax=uncultured Nocardioidaceae bacterium TaxID=253824 RepID=A0A6J4MYC3_9ACTN|nr:MAG: Para-aminobenzoate synthase, aminase component [uncultured Nocardioidaceae bacterium]